MRLILVLRTLGVLFLLFSLALVPPLLVALITRDGMWQPFLDAIGVAMTLAIVIWWPGRNQTFNVTNRDGFIIVALMWTVLGLLCALPFTFGIGLSLADAVFEAFSAFTTTGATVIVGLDALPPSILFYRQEMQWLGGIGVIVSAIALLPMLRVGGMQLYRAEASGPVKDEKLTPRIMQTARSLLKVYVAMTTLCAVLFYLAGMSLFDAISHSLSTLSTGGFSTHDASLAYFDSPMIEGIAVVFMLFGAINFGVHFMAFRNLDFGNYWRSIEVRVFLLTVAVLSLAIAWVLYATDVKTDLLTALRYSVFEVVSVITSTGFGIDDFSVWPLLLPALLIFISFLGGCAGSTAGGMKMVRWILLGKQGVAEIRQLVHPQSIVTIKMGDRVISQSVIQTVWAFFAVYIATFAVLMLAVMALGMDQVTAFGAVATCLNNLGPGLGDVAVNFANVKDVDKWIFAFAMLLGRLEIFTLLVLLSPAYWRN